MGRVTAKSKLLGYSPIDNYPEHEITDYIYCDKCGSFYVEDYTAGSGLLKIAAGFLIAALVAVVGYAIVNFSQGIPSTSMLYGIPAQLLECLGGSICVIFVPFIMFNIWMLKAAEAGHKCQKYGNTDIDEHHNVLDYASEDQSVIDAPLGKAHKHLRYT